MREYRSSPGQLFGNKPLNINPRKVKSDRMKGIGRRKLKIRKRSNTTLDDCLGRLLQISFWDPLPCREKDMMHINEFLENSFTSETPILLVICGESGTGKTSAIQLCISMSFNMNRIYYVDLHQTDYFIEELDQAKRTLVVLDNCNEMTDFEAILPYYYQNNASVIVTMQKTPNIERMPDYLTMITRLCKYDSLQLVTILQERLAETADFIDFSVLKYVADIVHHSHKGVPEAKYLLTQILKLAIEDQRESITIDDCEYYCSLVRNDLEQAPNILYQGTHEDFSIGLIDA